MSPNSTRPKFFKRRIQKITIATKKRQIIIPFKPISLFLIIILIFVSVFFAIRSDIFIVHQLEVEGLKQNECVKKEQIYEKLPFVGRSLIFIDYEPFSKDFKTNFLCIDSITFEKKWPDKIKIKLNFRQPMTILAINKTDQDTASQSANLNQATISASFDYFIIDNHGFVFGEVATSEANVPILFSKDFINVKLGAPVESKSLKVAVEILKNLSDLQLNIKTASISKEQIDVQLENDILVIFSKDKEGAIQTSSLQAIIRQSKIEGKKLTKIDLRFEKPIVIFK